MKKQKIATTTHGIVQRGLDMCSSESSGTVISYTGGPITTTEQLRPMESTISDKVHQISEVLKDCLVASASIRGTVFGEGEAGDSDEKLDGSLNSLLAAILTDVCNLRGELQSICTRVERSLPKKGVN